MNCSFVFRRGLFVTILVFFCTNASANSITLTTGNDEQSFLPYWQIAGKGINLRLVQRIPDQVRAFFMSRGFSTDDAEIIANSCVFQTVFKNVSNLTVPSTLKYSLRDWVVRTGEKEQGLKTREDWTKEWRAKKVAPASMLDFEWALVPTDFQYESGDYNWGMTLFNLKPGEKFDLEVVWHQYDGGEQPRADDPEGAP